MIAYLISSFVLLTSLLIIYATFMESEKMHRFNRFFLLACVCIGLVAPLISFEISTPYEPVIAGIQISEVDALVDRTGDYIVTGLEKEAVREQIPFIKPVSDLDSQSASNTSPLLIALLVIYLTGVVIGCIHFYKTLSGLLSKAHKFSSLKYQGAEIVLLQEEVLPHSFLNYIFLNENAYREGHISEEILNHELAHIQQKHSLDVLFVELVKVIFWFNPLIYFYKKAIQLNHEYLADQQVIKTGTDAGDYKDVLLQFMGNKGSQGLASTINFSLSKKRLVMMLKESSAWVVRTKLTVLVPVLAGYLFLYCIDVQSIDPPERIGNIKKSAFLYTPNIAGARDTNVVYSDFDIYRSRGHHLKEIHKTESGEVFTGTQLWYDGSSHYKRAEIVFDINGRISSAAYFDSTGFETRRVERQVKGEDYIKEDYYESSIHIASYEVWLEGNRYKRTRSMRNGEEIGRTEYDYSGDEQIDFKYFKNQVLSVHNYKENDYNYFKEYHENGRLKSEFSIIRSHSRSYSGPYHGIVGKYAEDGSIIGQERWDNGKLIETIVGQ